MRTRTNLIIEESILKKIDALAGEKHKRAAVIETALLEYIAREEAKAPPETEVKADGKKSGAKGK
jgi:metal-responsive CopG/Arc/MetJ family transcriptional regulator